MNFRLITRRIGGLSLLAVCGCAFNVIVCDAQRAPGSKAASVSSEQIISQLRQAASLLESGRAAEAEPLLRRVLVASPNNSDAHNLLGIVLDQAGKTAEAEREYRAAIRLNPSGISALTNLGVLFARNSRADEWIWRATMKPV